MTLAEQARQRVESAREQGREPVRWIAAADVLAQVSDLSGRLAGVPIEAGETRWGLELVLAPA